jgi:hypothetical protein
VKPTKTTPKVENQLQPLQGRWTPRLDRGGHLRDEGISGAKGRQQPPGLDALLKGVARRDFDIVAAWWLPDDRRLTGSTGEHQIAVAMRQSWCRPIVQFIAPERLLIVPNQFVLFATLRFCERLCRHRISRSADRL